MNDSMTIYGLALLWMGAVALGSLVLLRERWRSSAAVASSVFGEGWRKGIEAACLFAGSLGVIAGVGLLALGLMP